MIMIKGSIAVGTEDGMKYLSKFTHGGYPVMSFKNWDDLVKWGKKREKEVKAEEKDLQMPGPGKGEDGDYSGMD